MDQGKRMHEDTSELGAGPIDLSGFSLSELHDLSGSVLDHALARILARSADGHAAGFQSRV